MIGRRVAVYGGGNTAFDAARVARRLGADETVIVYRRTRGQMPAHEEEAQDAEREGVRVNWLRTITAFEGEELQIEVMELDADGCPAADRPFRDARRGHRDHGASGRRRDRFPAARCPGVEFDSDGTVTVHASLMTGCPGVFAGGDMVPSDRTVTVGVGHGKKAARHIDAWLRSVPAAGRPKHPIGNVRRSCTCGISATPRAGSSRNSRPRRASPGSPRWCAV